MIEKEIDEKKQGEALSIKNNLSTSKKMYLESYGCQMNFSDSEIVASILTSEGFTTTKNIEELIDNSLEKNGNPTFILLDGITDVRNFGAIIRTAVATNVAGIIISQSNSAPINSDVVKTSAGTLFNMPICKVNNLKDAIMHLKASNIEIISLTENAEKSIYERVLDKPIAIILGSENKGISNGLLSISDDKIHIPISNKIDSLNVSVAFSVMIFEIIKQKGL